MGLRREVLILLPMAILLLALLSTFTLVSYRNALLGAVEERRIEAGRLVQRLAQEAGSASSLELLARAPGALGVAFLDADGWPNEASGDLPVTNLLPPGLDLPSGEPLAWGPGPKALDRVVGLVRAPGGGAGTRILRVDLPAHRLGAQLRSLKILGVVVLAVNGSVLVLVVLFLRNLLAPWEKMLEKARALSNPAEDQDEAALLLATFEAALEAQARELKNPSTEDDIAALQRTLTDNLESGLLLLDRRGQVLSLNRVGGSLLGVATTMAAGQGLESLLGVHGELVTKLQEAIELRQGFRRHELFVVVEGVKRTVGLTVHLLRRGDREVRGYLVLFADLTESQRRARQSSLEESLVQLGEMAAGMAHELRNSLATVRGYLTLVERGPEEEVLADYLQEIRQETNHLQRVLEDFLLFARPGSARPAETDFAAVLRRALADPALDAVGLRLERLGGDDCRLLGDAQLLEHAVKNLLANAARAQREAGVDEPLEVFLESSPKELVLSICDAGAGVPPEVRERLFQPFVSQFRGGVGLGLAVTYRIVSLHGGRLSLEQRDVGGTRAVVVFPREKNVTEGSDSPF